MPDEQLLDTLAEGAEELGVALASLSEAYEHARRSERRALEEQLFRPVQAAYGRAKRTHAEFAERHELQGREFPSPVPGAPSKGAKGFLDAAMQAIGAADLKLGDAAGLDAARRGRRPRAACRDSSRCARRSPTCAPARTSCCAPSDAEPAGRVAGRPSCGSLGRHSTAAPLAVSWTSMLPRVALEYGHTACAALTISTASAESSTLGSVTSRRTDSRKPPLPSGASATSDSIAALSASAFSASRDDAERALETGGVADGEQLLGVRASAASAHLGRETQIDLQRAVARRCRVPRRGLR